MEPTLDELTAAWKANPVHPAPIAALAQGLFAAGDYPGTVEAALRAAELGAGEYGEMALLAARAARRAGDRESAVHLLVFSLD